MRRVVVTGLGILSPIGNTVDEFCASLKAGKHGLTLESWFPTQTEEKNVVARVKNFDDSEYIDKKEARRTDFVTRYAVYASKKALEDAGTTFDDIDPYRRGVIIASGIGGIQTTEEQILNYHNKGISNLRHGWAGTKKRAGITRRKRQPLRANISKHHIS